MAADIGCLAVEGCDAPRDVENKRKYDAAGLTEEESGLRYNDNSNAVDEGGFPSAAAAPVSCNSIATSMSEFELAKQRAELIAARLVTNAEFKRPRIEDNSEEQHSGLDRSNISNFDQRYPDHHQEDDRLHPENHSEQLLHHHQHHLQQQQQFQHLPSQEYQQLQFDNCQGNKGTQSRKIDVPNSKVGLVIGKGGETIKYIQQQSGARIHVARDADSDPRLSTRQVELMGGAEQISHAEQLLKDVIAEASSGGPVALGGCGRGPSSEQIHVKVPNNKVGLIIGRGGETIKSLQSRSGVRIQVQNDSETEPGATERIVTLTGNKKATDVAYDMIKEVIDENRITRGPPGGYRNQRGGYRLSGPPQQWGPPAAPLPSYGGYLQATQYPVPQQYQGPQAYGAYPQQPSTDYASSGWDQHTPVNAALPLPHGSWDYYAQQAQQGYYGGYQQQQQTHAAGYGDQTVMYGQQQGITQQAYVQQGYSYAQPAQQQGDQQGYSQQGFAYSQAEAGYAAAQLTGTAVAATSAPHSATTPALPPLTQS